ncbi:Uncharacterised protein [Mycolicibacterium vanbaalenii]|uniref:Uncharacterized protein n=1 Tax=Mycolicibacterium vanbaalenii TaxID=110539 RepID=A0A5S9R8Y8_MYCVN|nr:Uncharacterised protein [Mycolicibacterium vanbaalenii]
MSARSMRLFQDGAMTFQKKTDGGAVNSATDGGAVNSAPDGGASPGPPTVCANCLSAPVSPGSRTPGMV